MPSVLERAKTNGRYLFIVVGFAWVGGVYLAGPLLLWPVFACIVAGLLLWFRPELRLTEPWARASAVMGLVLSAYQAYLAIPLLSGTLSTVAAGALAAFTVFAVVHLFLLWLGSVGKVPQTK